MPRSLLHALRPSRALMSSLVLALSALVPGCSFESMTVELSWGTAQTTCFEAGVNRMSYTLYDSFGVVDSGTNVRCGDLNFSSLALDTYDLDIFGYDAAGVEVYGATCAGLFFEGTDITHRCTVPYSGENLEVEVAWDLDSTPGGFVAGSCAAAGVNDYDFALYDAGNNLVSSGVEVLCTGSGAIVLDFGTQPYGDYTVEITGYDSNGVDYWFGSCTVSPSDTTLWVCNAFDNG